MLHCLPVLFLKCVDSTVALGRQERWGVLEPLVSSYLTAAVIVITEACQIHHRVRNRHLRLERYFPSAFEECQHLEVSGSFGHRRHLEAA